MSVKKLTMNLDSSQFVLKTLRDECGALQFIRELYENAVQNGATDVEWTFTLVNGVPKLVHKDNGSGMSGLNLEQYMGMLFKSGHSLGENNFGLGAKIACAKASPFGTIWLTRDTVRGPAAKVRLEFDPKTQDYGCHIWQGGNVVTTENVSWRGTGTEVILMGQDAKQDTTRLDRTIPGCVGGVFWIHYAMNSRYWDLTSYNGEVITVKAPEWAAKKAHPRPVTGMKGILDARLDSSRGRGMGVIKMSTCDVAWYIIKEEEGWTNRRAPMAHIAFRHGNELYDMCIGSKAAAMMHRAGVLANNRKLVLHFLPHGNVKANLARTSLSLDGKPLDYDALLVELCENLPKEIRTLVEEGSQSEPRSKTSSSVFQKYLGIISQFKPAPRKVALVGAGKEAFDGDATEVVSGPSTPRGRGETDTDKDKRKNPKPHVTISLGNGTKVVGALTNLKKGRKKGSIEEAPFACPIVRWFESTDGAGDRDPWLVAEYYDNQNLIACNGDFVPLVLLINRLHEPYKRNPGAYGRVQEIVRKLAEELILAGVVQYLGILHTASDTWKKPLTSFDLTMACNLMVLEERARHAVSQKVTMAKELEN